MLKSPPFLADKVIAMLFPITSRSPALPDRLSRLELSIRQAEKLICPPHLRMTPIGGGGERIIFDTAAPNSGEYRASDLSKFLRILERIEPYLSLDKPFVDLGSGLGAICFAAALYLNWCRVVGIEFDERLVAAAEQIKQGHGITNVEFRRGDFLRADLSEFGTVYAYHSFSDNYASLMGAALARTKPGTVIIADMIPLSSLAEMFPNQFYAQLLEVPDPPYSSFTCRAFQHL